VRSEPLVSRGRLRIYLGAAPGVGKTFAMLDEGHRRRSRGADVVVGVVETHGRSNTAARIGDLEVLPRRAVAHRGAQLEELDIDALLARHPDVALVDELAHTNVTGSRNAKRWADIEELLDAGIDVISTVNIQHLESVNDVVERITGVRQRETVPDEWVRRAEQVELVDMTPEALRRRLAHGNVYPAERIDAAMSNYFRPGNLAALRELALLWVADRVEDQLQEYLRDHDIPGAWETRERVLVALTGAPGNDAVIRRAARIAGRVGGDLVGVHVVSSDGLVGHTEGTLVEHRRLLEELGGTYRDVVGDDVAETLVAAARTDRATQLVIGASRRSRWDEVRGGSVVNRLLRLARDLDIHVISNEPPEASGPSAPRAGRGSGRRSVALPPRRVIWAWVLLVVGLPLLVVTLHLLGPDVGLATEVLAALVLVLATAALGGLTPGIVGSVAAVLAINYFLVEPVGTFRIADPENLVALLVFVAVASTVATLMDRVRRRSLEASRATAEAAALARSSAVLATVPDPLPDLLEQLRVLAEVQGVAVLRRTETGAWLVEEHAGEPSPVRPADGTAYDLTPDGRTVVVFRPAPAGGGTSIVLDAFIDALSVALDTRRLQAEAADAAVVAEADALRTGILQAVSHDLRTPLAGIKASVTSLLSTDVTFDADVTREFLRTIDAEVDRLDRVVGNLLDMGRLQAGALSVLRRPTALEEVVSAALGHLDLAQDQVEVTVPETLPLVDVDGALLERAVANVVANAVAVQPGESPVRIQAAVIQRGDEARVALQVVDHGPGLAASAKVKAFEPFQRLGDRSTQAGVGLGLAIAQGFTTAVGGTLTLDDTPGGGLTVTFELLAAD
jgi:two-component system sensor histidine kinase KdpD